MCERLPPGTSTQVTSPGIELADGSGRLPGNVKPIFYGILLQPDLENGSFMGQVAITAEVVHDTNQIVLHSVDLQVQGMLILNEGQLLRPKITVQEQNETITLEVEEVLRTGTEAVIYIAFKGSLTGRQSGLYRGAYKSDNGVKKYYAVTQMQACDARRALPCFDEPALKATFQVTLVAQPEMTCLSNMDVFKEQSWPPDDAHASKWAITFNITPPMSTYLRAFVIGDLNYIQVDSFRVPIRLYTTPDRNVEDGRYAAEITAKAMTFYEEKFGAKYPLPKLDLVGVAARGGAMENWGCILFQDRKLLVDKAMASASEKVNISYVVLHEEAHLWFGDIVTME